MLSLPEGVRIRYRSIKADEDQPTIVAIHGMSGSFNSQYMLALSHKAYREGWNSILLNLHSENRSLSPPKIFHAGSSKDLIEALRILHLTVDFKKVFLVGVSMGGNILLKALGEWGRQVPSFLAGAAVISPLLDLTLSAPMLESRSNRLYRYYYVRRLKKQAMKLSPDLGRFINLEELKSVKGILDFDRVLTVPLGGFRSLEQYYSNASSAPLLPNVALPTFIIHSKDDPLLPFQPLESEGANRNSMLFSSLTLKGGHVAFVENKRTDIDRSWAENRVIDYFRILKRNL
jgi:predicted alpha/beta-fold hydrolase